jgi:ATP-dependent phosphofructokinase / diphosphate-dependent phosphofructokinase
VVAEGIHPARDATYLPNQKPSCGRGQYIADCIAKSSAYPVDTRVSVLGHIQRGGIPSALDRLTAAAFGKTAVDLIAKGQSNQMVAWQNGQVAAVPIADVCDRSPLAVVPYSDLVLTARALGTYVGE